VQHYYFSVGAFDEVVLFVYAFSESFESFFDFFMLHGDRLIIY